MEKSSKGHACRPACRTGRQAGFTLIELLVVIAIMSILTVITVSQFQNARKKARDVARKGDLNAVSKAVLMYYNDYGRLPSATADGRLEVDSETIEWGGGEFRDATDYVYLKMMPKENTSSLPEYCYLVSTDGTKFALLSALENGEDSEYNKYVVEPEVGYSGCGDTDNYHFVYFSPNANWDDFNQK